MKCDERDYIVMVLAFMVLAFCVGTMSHPFWCRWSPYNTGVEKQ